MSEIDGLLDQVLNLLTNTFDFPEAEARHRIALWRAEQHRLEGDMLTAITPHLPPEEALQQILRHVLQGEDIRRTLEQGAEELNL